MVYLLMGLRSFSGRSVPPFGQENVADYPCRNYTRLQKYMNNFYFYNNPNHRVSKVQPAAIEP